MSLLPDGYLHTSGSSILGADNAPVRLAGVNWYGFECNSMVAGGLDHRTIGAIAGTIRDLGFNHVRLPFSVEAVQDNPTVEQFLDAEPPLIGRHVLEIMDAVVEGLGQAGLKVVLDCHRSDAGWSTQENGLWYTQEYPEEAFLRAWETLAQRYRSNTTVIGCDIRNEPGSPPPDPNAWPANGGSLWGFGGSRQRDFHDAATRAANTILNVNPDLLIFVEGVREDPAGPQENHNSYWFGGNLMGVKHSALPQRWTAAPIELSVPGRLVYAPHTYGPFMYHGLPWCRLGSTANTPDACNQVWDKVWGYIAEENIAPIWIGEFGTPNGLRPNQNAPQQVWTDINDTHAQGIWFTYLTDYIRQHDLNWCYWAINGTRSLSPGRNPNQIEGFGVLAPDWQDIASQPLYSKLQSIL